MPQAMQTTKTTCPYCGVGCGLKVSAQTDGSFKVAGDPSHPSNGGKICSKGAALGETLSLDDRLLQPSVDGLPCEWDHALNSVASRFSQIIRQHGPDAVAFYVSGQLLTEDYYVANKLMKGFIGSANIDTNSRLCMSSSVAGHKRAFGSDTVPGCYQDLEQADLLILTGSNLAWCHPVLYQRVLAAKKARPQMKVIVIDPRRTATCEIADLHLAIKPASDSFLFSGLLNWLYQQGKADSEFITQHCEGLDQALKSAQWYAPSSALVAEQCGLSTESVATFFHWFANHTKTVTVYSQGINQSSTGTDKVNAIINCHLLTGRIGKPAMGPFSITGQPNAMGGREVGALSNQLAAHMDFDQADHIDLVERFWQAERMARQPGLKAVDLFDAIHQGRIKAIWIIATNPAVSMPEASQVRQALQNCELVVVSDCNRNTDTTRYADILLPALGWGEKAGTVTSSERCISRQRPFLPPAGAARADWWILASVAQRMGYAGFDYTSAHQIFCEHARLSAFENAGSRDFDLSGLAAISAEQYENFSPVQWPVKAGLHEGQARLFGDGQFFTANKKARFIAVTPGPPGDAPNADYALVLNTGRIRDQWHTMTRTGKSPRLNGHVSEPFAELHPCDAEQLDIQDGQIVRLQSRHGEVLLRAQVTQTQRPGSVFVPMHWNDQFASCAAIDRVVNAFQDPLSGQPEFKHTPVRVQPYGASWYGFVLAREQINTDAVSYWSSSKRQDLWHYELAGTTSAEDWADAAIKMLPAVNADTQWSELFDSTQQTYRAARFIDGRLDSCVFISNHFTLPARDWLITLFSQPLIQRSDRLRVLAGTPAGAQQDGGKTICSCFNVGRNTLIETIRKSALTSTEQIGACLQAGTNCGSCLPELRELLAQSAGS